MMTIWMRSSRCCADKPQCVEVGKRGDVVYIRDSKAAEGGIVLETSRAAFAAFLTQIKDSTTTDFYGTIQVAMEGPLGWRVWLSGRRLRLNFDGGEITAFYEGAQAGEFDQFAGLLAAAPA